MKSSKFENFYEEKENSKALSPFTLYQPFHSSFDPEFSTFSANPNIWSDAPQLERSSMTPGMSTSGTFSEWSLQTSTTQPPVSLLCDFSTASTSTWRKPEGRSICNTSWMNDTSPASAPFSNFGDCPSPSFNAVERFGLYPRSNTGFVGGPLRAGSLSSREVLDSQNGGSLTGSSERNLFFRSGHTRPMMCNFCKNNKEVPDIYLTHYLYDPETKTLSCPVLRKHICELCGKTGDEAHTLQYCPVNKERGLQSKVPVILKKRTITNSTGKIRRN